MPEFHPFKLTADVAILADSPEEAQQKAEGFWSIFADGLNTQAASFDRDCFTFDLKVERDG